MQNSLNNINVNNKKYKVLLVHNFYQLPGGEDTVFQNEKMLLENNGYQVITYTRNNSEFKNSIIKKILLPYVIIFNVKTYIDIRKIIKEYDIDLVHVHNTLCLISPSVYYAALSMKKPIIQTLHNFRLQCANGLFYRNNRICEDCIDKGLRCALKYKCYRNSFFQSLAIILMIKIHRFIGIYKRVNFICLTEFNKDKLLHINKYKKIVDENKIFIKPNFVFDENKISAKNMTNISNQYFASSKKLDTENNKRGYYLYVGRLDELKGVDIVLDAFSKMLDKELHVVGSGGEKYIKKFSMYSNIKFLGQYNHDEVISEMRRCQALIYPTKLYEGQPISIIEAYMNGVPVISSNIGNANELVVENKTGLHFESNDSNSLINTINTFETFDKNMYKDNTILEFKNRYSEENSLNILSNIYSTILEQNQFTK